MVISAEQATLVELLDDGGVIAGFPFPVPDFIAVEIAAQDGGFAAKPLRMTGDGFVDLADIAFDDAAFDGHGPDGDETKIAGAVGDGERNHPAVGRFFDARDAQRVGDEHAEAFARVVAEPTAVEALAEAELQVLFGAFGDDRDVGLEIIEWPALASKSHPTIPNDDFHTEAQ